MLCFVFSNLCRKVSLLFFITTFKWLCIEWFYGVPTSFLKMGAWLTRLLAWIAGSGVLAALSNGYEASMTGIRAKC